MRASLRDARVAVADERELGLTFASAVVTGLGCVLVLVRADEGIGVVNLLVVPGLIVHFVSLFAGMRNLVGAAVLLLLSAATVDILIADAEPRVVTVAIGCLWFAGAQLGWEAIGRRGGLRRNRTAQRRWEFDNVAVMALAVVVGLLGVFGAGAPPVRTVLLQAIAFGLVVSAALVLARRALTNQPEDSSPGF